jgi:hypothetical protein
MKTILLHSHGTITYDFIDPDDTKQPEPEKIVNVLKNMTHEK